MREGKGGGEVYVSMAETEICGRIAEKLSEIEPKRSFWLVGAASGDLPTHIQTLVAVAWGKWRRASTLTRLQTIAPPSPSIIAHIVFSARLVEMTVLRSNDASHPHYGWLARAFAPLSPHAQSSLNRVEASKPNHCASSRTGELDMQTFLTCSSQDPECPDDSVVRS
jgi:hypothetical protein